MNLEQFRRDYLQGGLRRNDLPNDPFALFAGWQQQAIQSGLLDPTAMVVASVDAAGQPSQRIVLLKNVDEQGFVFYTNYASRKAQEIAANAKLAAKKQTPILPCIPIQRFEFPKPLSGK